MNGWLRTTRAKVMLGIILVILALPYVAGYLFEVVL
mgnify:CR=1 FL=1